jgi:DNA-binding transcriptional ArsR family regulator
LVVKTTEELYTKKEYESSLLRAFGNSPKLRIIDFLLDNPLFDFTKKEVVEALGMSKQTFYKYFEDLEDLALVRVSRKIGKAKLYKINLENPMVKLVRGYETELSLQAADQEKAKMQKPISARVR